MVSSSVQGGGGGSWVLRAADMSSILSALLCLGRLWRAGRGQQEGTGHPPSPSSQEPQLLDSRRDQGYWWEENQPKLSLANLSLPGLILGQRTPNPEGRPSRVSWDPCLTWALETWWVRGRGPGILLKPGRAPVLSWGVRGGEVLGLCLWLPSRDLPQAHHLSWDSFRQLQSSNVNTLYAELECASEYTDHQGVCYSWPALFRAGNGNAFQYSCLQNPMDGRAARVQSRRSQRARHDWATSLSFISF